MTSGPIKLLAVCGSLRSGSSNATLLEAATRITSGDAITTHFNGIGHLPAFNPDLDGDKPDVAVMHWRAALASADAVLISSPEYAHGIPGALKNALDWVVGSNELYLKPVVLLNTSSESQFAHPQLAEVLRTMTANVIPLASATIPIARRGATVASILSDPALSSALSVAMNALLNAARAHRSS